MSASSLSCLNLQSYFCDQCNTVEDGGIRAVAFSIVGAPMLDPSNNQDWFDLICNGYAVIIPDVRGTYDGGAVTEGPGYGNQSTRIQSRNHTLTYMHTWNCNNMSFYDTLSLLSNFEVWFLTDTKIFRSNKAVMIAPTVPIAEAKGDSVEFNVTVKWADRQLPTCYDRPGIMESCRSIEAAFNCLTCNPVQLYPC